MKKLLAALIASALLTSAAQADYTMTAQLTNSVGTSVSRASTPTPTCSPTGSSCTTPSSISNGTTANIVHQFTSSQTVGPLTIVRYRYTSGTTTKSCQLQMSVDRSASNPSQCALNTFSATFTRTDGTGSSPVCTRGAIVTANYATCTFVVNVSMAN